MRKQFGFTLMEMMITIMILGILLGIVIRTNTFGHLTK